MTDQKTSEIFQKYQNKWIALKDDDDFICAADSCDEVLGLAKSKGYDSPFVFLVPDLNYCYNCIL